MNVLQKVLGVGVTAAVIALSGCNESRVAEYTELNGTIKNNKANRVVESVSGKIISVQPVVLNYCGERAHQFNYVILKDDLSKVRIFVQPFVEATPELEATIKFEKIIGERIDSGDFIKEYVDSVCSEELTGDLVISAEGIIVPNGIEYNDVK